MFISIPVQQHLNLSDMSMLEREPVATPFSSSQVWSTSGLLKNVNRKRRRPIERAGTSLVCLARHLASEIKAKPSKLGVNTMKLRLDLIIYLIESEVNAILTNEASCTQRLRYNRKT